MFRLQRGLAVTAALLLLGAVYQSFVSAVRILALPRFEIPYVNPAAGLCGFGHFDPYEWLLLALVSLGLGWAPLGWVGRRRKLVARCAATLATLTGALGAAWLLLVGSAVRAIFDAMRAWRGKAQLSHPGFHYIDYSALLTITQIGLGVVAFALGLLSVWTRLCECRRLRAELVSAPRAGLLLLVGAEISVRSAWLNEAGCFPVWPAFRRDAPESWDGLWTTSVGFYAGCLLLGFVAWPAMQRSARFLGAGALGVIFALQHGQWGPQCTCQAVDVPSVPVSTLATARYPVEPDTSFDPSRAVELSERGVRWEQQQFATVPTFLDALAAESARRRELSALLKTHRPPTNLALRLARGASVVQVREVVAGARRAGFTGIAFELGYEPWHAEVGWGIRLSTVQLLRVAVPLDDSCSSPLELPPEEAADTWWQRIESQLSVEDCCLSSPSRGSR